MMPAKNNISKLIDSPIILTGRGGSGTRLLSCLIQDIGIFLGNDINETEDSVEWVSSIYNLVINDIRISNNRFSLHNINELRSTASHILSTKRKGIKAWGLKLPETMLCLPELLKSFPDAKIIHLIRHPVTLSLRRSHMTSRLGNKIGEAVLSRAYKFNGIDFSKASSASDTINNAISWNYQLNQVHEFAKNKLNKNNYIEVRYEDICSNPLVVRSKLNSFLNFEGADKDQSCLDIDFARMKKFDSEDKDIQRVWEICKEIAIKLGYSKQEVL